MPWLLLARTIYKFRNLNVENVIDGLAASLFATTLNAVIFYYVDNTEQNKLGDLK